MYFLDGLTLGWPIDIPAAGAGRAGRQAWWNDEQAGRAVRFLYGRRAQLRGLGLGPACLEARGKFADSPEFKACCAREAVYIPLAIYLPLLGFEPPFEAVSLLSKFHA